MKDKPQKDKMIEAINAALIINNRKAPLAARIWILKIYEKELEELCQFLKYLSEPTIIKELPP